MRIRMVALIAGALLSVGSAQLAAQSPVASFIGTVLSDSAERPIANATVELTDIGMSAKSDSVGDFTMSGIPAGAHQVEVRAANYMLLSVVITFGQNETVARDFLLQRGTDVRLLIDRAKIAAVTNRLSEFESRRRMKSGHYLTQADFAKSGGRQLSDILVSKVPGLQAVSNNGERSMATSSRGKSTARSTPGEDGKQKQCYVQIIIDGVVRYRSTPGEKLFNIDAVNPAHVQGIEFYTVAQTPLQFNSTGSATCGTLLIWQTT